MARRTSSRRVNHEEILRLVLAEDSDDDFDPGSSADEEAELERQLDIFGDNSR